jgi:hypothetical protein
VKKEKDYAGAIFQASDLIRRISTAHSQSKNVVMHDLELVLVDDADYSHEAYFGVRACTPVGTQHRMNLPIGIPVATQYHVYLSPWGDVILRPVIEPRKQRLSKIIEVQ